MVIWILVLKNLEEVLQLPTELPLCYVVWLIHIKILVALRLINIIESVESRITGSRELINHFRVFEHRYNTLIIDIEGENDSVNLFSKCKD